MFDEGEESPLKLNKTDGLVVQGQIMRVSGRSLPLEHCEILQVVPHEELVPEAQKLAGESPKPADKRETSPSSEKPRLPDGALKLWFQAFKIAYPHGSQMLAEKSAAAAFPNHHVARKRIREFFPDSPRGRPKQINDLDNSPKNDGE